MSSPRAQRSRRVNSACLHPCVLVRFTHDSSTQNASSVKTVVNEDMAQARILRAWLCVVAMLRFLSVGLCLFDTERLARTLFVAAPDQLTPLAARIFASWTTLSGFVCLFCAKEGAHPHSSIYMLTELSFVVPLLLFVTEIAFHGTMTLMSVATPSTVATVSLVWMASVRRNTKRRD
jgi:hypothetical protein